MRLSKEMIHYLSDKIVNSLEEKKMIEIDSNRNEVIEKIGMAVKKELLVEEDLNQEVKDILDAHEKNLDSKGIDYRKMFLMIKGKLARERSIIL